MTPNENAMRTLTSAILFLLALHHLPPQLGAQEGPPAAENKPTSEEIATWVGQLSAGRFAERELATLRLVEAGTEAVSPVREAIEEQGLEAAQRGLHVLRQLALSGDEPTEDAARAALEQIAQNEQSRARLRARRTLDYLNEIRQDRAIAAIRNLGGKVEEATYNQFIGAWQLVTTFSVTIDENWKGDRQGLKYLRWLPDLRMVTFRGEQVKDDWVESIKGLEKISVVELNRTSVGDKGLAVMKTLPKLDRLTVKYSPVTDGAVDELKQLKIASTIMLFGTDMTRAGAEKLREEIAGANVRIDYRRGAFLGVGCQQTDAGCTISQIHPDSAAESAGLREQDVVTEYAGQPVPDFQTLTKFIAENVAGDKVTVKVRRNGTEEISKEVTLGEWD